MIVNSLVSRGFVKHADNPDEIMITQEGINMCYRMDRTGWHANDYPNGLTLRKRLNLFDMTTLL